MNVIEKIKSMTAKEIILSMVEGLRNPYTKIAMCTFGDVNIHGVCFGCAATNAICKIADIDKKILPNILAKGFISRNQWPFMESESDEIFMHEFERAIDALRSSNISGYNYIASKIDIAKIRNNDMLLPILNNNYIKEDLEKYVELANAQE